MEEALEIQYKVQCIVQLPKAKIEKPFSLPARLKLETISFFKYRIWLMPVVSQPVSSGL